MTDPACLHDWDVPGGHCKKCGKCEESLGPHAHEPFLYGFATEQELHAAFETVSKVMDKYKTGTREWATLCEARRLIEWEARQIDVDTNQWH